jgi:uncharacterized protein YigA (DUF484 family)
MVSSLREWQLQKQREADKKEEAASKLRRLEESAIKAIALSDFYHSASWKEKALACLRSHRHSKRSR